MKTIDQQIDELQPTWAKLIEALIPDIQDDYRASEDDEEPSMCLTIGFTPETKHFDASWSYQTGDNSFAGDAYGHPHWGVVSLCRDSKAADIAEEIANQIGELCADSVNYNE